MYPLDQWLIIFVCRDIRLWSF